MKTFKKISALLLALMMALTLFGCDSKKADDSKEDVKNETSAVENNGSNKITADSAENALEIYFKSIEKCDAENYISVLPEYIKFTVEKYGSFSSLMDAAEKELESTLNELEAEYGKNVKINIDVNKVRKMTDKYHEMIDGFYQQDESLANVMIEVYMEVDFEITVEGKDGSDEGTGTAYAIKENGEWKIMDVETEGIDGLIF